MKIHCFFEQSGTFKNEFIKFGFQALDYDLLNDFGQTDFIIDLFNEIEEAYCNRPSLFDTITKDDLIFAFFPCTRFENNIGMWFRGAAHGIKDKPICDKLWYDLFLVDELHQLYHMITKLVLVCLERNLKLIIENPYSEQHFLIRYWALKPTIIDYDRRLFGDYFKKPTMYYFINVEPRYNFVFEGVDIKNKKTINNTSNKVERSLISPDYANRFIREFIL